MRTCVFCSDKNIRAREILRNKFARAFPSRLPIVPMHTLIVPIRHVGTFDNLKDQEVLAMFAIAKKLKRVLSRSFGAKGFNFAWNDGAVAGQRVRHFHLHMLPRRKGDTGITKYNPRKFLYRPGSRKRTSESELRAVASDIRRAF